VNSANNISVSTYGFRQREVLRRGSVNAKRREVLLSAFGVFRYFCRDFRHSSPNSALSLLVERHRGTTETFKVPVAGREISKKLSESLVTAPRRVTSLVSLASYLLSTNCSYDQPRRCDKISSRGSNSLSASQAVPASQSGHRDYPDKYIWHDDAGEFVNSQSRGHRMRHYG
jgi:hypothetical protein